MTGSHLILNTTGGINQETIPTIQAFTGYIITKLSGTTGTMSLETRVTLSNLHNLDSFCWDQIAVLLHTYTFLILELLLYVLTYFFYCYR